MFYVNVLRESPGRWQTTLLPILLGDLSGCTAQHPPGWSVLEAKRLPQLGYGQDKHETHSGPASPCVDALARPRRRVWPPEGLPVL